MCAPLLVSATVLHLMSATVCNRMSKFACKHPIALQLRSRHKLVAVWALMQACTGQRALNGNSHEMQPLAQAVLRDVHRVLERHGLPTDNCSSTDRLLTALLSKEPGSGIRRSSWRYWLGLLALLALFIISTWNWQLDKPV